MPLIVGICLVIIVAASVYMIIDVTGEVCCDEEDVDAVTVGCVAP